MGIQGLLPLLKSIHKPCNLKKFAGQTIGVDAYGWLHKGTISCAIELAMDKPTSKFVDFAMRQVRMLQHFGVIPFIIFDGDYLPSKAATEARRLQKREESKRLGLELLQAGKTSQAYQELRKAIDVTPEMARQLIDELKKSGIQYIVAPYEADAQMVYLERKGLISGILSEDSDLLVFGAKCLLTKLDQYGNCIEINKNDFCACREVNLTGWSDDEFRCMAILTGCDYLTGLRAIGLKTAHRMVREHKTIEKVVRMMQFDGKHHLSDPQDYLDKFHQAECTFMHQRVYCPISNTLVFHTEPNQPFDEQKMLFIGAYVEPDVARKVAVGDLNPMTKQPLLPRLSQTARASRASGTMTKSQPWRTVTTDDLKKGISIEQFFKPNKRIPLGELDPNSFTPSPTQQNALLRNTGSWPAEPIPRQYLRRSTTDIQPQALSVPNITGERNLPWTTTPSESRPQKRSRLCADDATVDSVTTSNNSGLGRSPFFDPMGLHTSPFACRLSKAKRSKKDDIAIFSDDSIEEALLALPDFGHWHTSKPKTVESFKILSDEDQSPAQSAHGMNPTNIEPHANDAKDSQISLPGLTQSSSILSSGDEVPTQVDNVVAPVMSGLKEKFSFTPTQKSLLHQPFNELPTPPSSLKQSRIPRAIKPKDAAVSSGRPAQPRVMTPLQSLGAKALNRSSRFLQTPPFTPKPAASAVLSRSKRTPPSTSVSTRGVPFPEVVGSSFLKVTTQLDPATVPLPNPDQEEILALSVSTTYDVGMDASVVMTHESKGSEDLIIYDSEEELDHDETLSPNDTPTITTRLGLDKFAFKGCL